MGKGGGRGEGVGKVKKGGWWEERGREEGKRRRG